MGRPVSHFKKMGSDPTLVVVTKFEFYVECLASSVQP